MNKPKILGCQNKRNKIGKPTTRKPNARTCYTCNLAQLSKLTPFNTFQVEANPYKLKVTSTYNSCESQRTIERIRSKKTLEPMSLRLTVGQ